jgi:two-component system response regulator PilR (NtrC family)
LSIRPIIGSSPEIKALLALIERVSGTKTNILVTGESGTGKELVARMIHESGPLKGKAFIPVNCGAIPENLIESEMFGHKKGSFTGAHVDKTGLFEAANGGTIFLDEVGELPLNMQVKLLRALQERTIRKVGGNDDIRCDARVIAATNRDLEAAAAAGTFREDLFYRLNVIMIRTPALRERRSDIPILAEHFLKKFSVKVVKPLEGFDAAAMAALQSYDWPGNVRELENTLERACILENGNKVSLEALPGPIKAAAKISHATSVGSGSVSVTDRPLEAGAAPGLPGAAKDQDIRIPAPDFSKGPVNLDDILGDVERVFLKRALEHTAGVKKSAAELLGITFRSIRYRLKKLGIETKDASDDDGE